MVQPNMQALSWAIDSAGLVIAAIIFAWLFLQGMMTMTIALCTLSGPEPRRRRIGDSITGVDAGALN